MLFDRPRDLCIVLKVRGASHSLYGFWVFVAFGLLRAQHVVRTSVVRVVAMGLRNQMISDATISIFWGVGLSFHAFNESRQPCSLITSGMSAQSSSAVLLLLEAFLLHYQFLCSKAVLYHIFYRRPAHSVHSWCDQLLNISMGVAPCKARAR